MEGALMSEGNCSDTLQGISFAEDAITYTSSLPPETVPRSRTFGTLGVPFVRGIRSEHDSRLPVSLPSLDFHSSQQHSPEIFCTY